jgi:hypothetical protein
MLQRPPDNSEAAAASNALSHVKYRPDIDGLLAVAVLSVVFFHAFPDYPAPVRNAGAERELTMMRWGMPPPAEVRQRLKTEASNARFEWRKAIVWKDYCGSTKRYRAPGQSNDGQR